MMRLIRVALPSLLLPVLLALSNNVFAQAVTQAEAKAFFKQYVALSDAFDDALVDLYAPAASIVGLRREDNGDTTKQELTGAQWQQLLGFNMAKAQKRNERSTYSKLRFTPQDKAMKITADRYSIRKCFTDSAYFMVVARRADKRLHIVEESFATHLPDQCR
ncbi:MAG: hypothetical protein K2X64_11570 [Rhodocyclaceae bacterium]|nr:hypothetical protein [Rhodocyclaceae bacterium]